jgi:regulator of nonsense transcripts 2
LHTRLSPDFLPLLLPQLLAVLAPAPSAPAIKEGDKDREREDKERIARQRLVLRIAAELAMVGAWAEGAAKGAAEVGKVLKALVSPCRSILRRASGDRAAHTDTTDER